MNQFTIGGLILALLGAALYFSGHPFRHADAIGLLTVLQIGGGIIFMVFGAIGLLLGFVFWMLSKT